MCLINYKKNVKNLRNDLSDSIKTVESSIDSKDVHEITQSIDELKFKLNKLLFLNKSYLFLKRQRVRNFKSFFKQSVSECIVFFLFQLFLGVGKKYFKGIFNIIFLFKKLFLDLIWAGNFFPFLWRYSQKTCVCVVVYHVDTVSAQSIAMPICAKIVADLADRKRTTWTSMANFAGLSLTLKEQLSEKCSWVC